MEPLARDALLGYLSCPGCGSPDLAAAEVTVSCPACKRQFPVRRNVIDFLLYDQMGETERKELKAMTLSLDDELKLQWLIDKEQWDKIQTHFLTRGIQAAMRYLAPYARPGVTLVTLGSGAGFELRMLTRSLSFERIIGSDISWTASYAIGKSLEDKPARVGLIACDFNKCPVKRSAETVGFVFEALHHTDDVHQTIEHLLAGNFDHFVFVEPTRNWLVNVLSKFGLTMNIEYSGLKPDWIDLRIVRKIARRCGYQMQVTTWWPFPDSLVPAMVKKSSVLSAILCRSVDGFSALTRVFNFGAMSAVYLKRQSTR